MVERVDPAKIHGFERSNAGPAESKSIFHNSVNIFSRNNTFFHQRQGFPHDSQLDAVCSKTQDILIDNDRFLSNGAGKVPNGLSHVLAGFVIFNDFNKENKRRRIEPVHP